MAYRMSVAFGMLLAMLSMGAMMLSCGKESSEPEPLSGATSCEINPEPVTFDLVTERVFKPKCYKCHDTNNERGLIDLSNRLLVKDAIGTILFVTVVTRQMPPASSGKSIDRCDRQLIADWPIDGLK